MTLDRILLALILWNVADAIFHIAFNAIEPLRFTANVVMIVVVTLIRRELINTRVPLWLHGTGLVYLLLNVLFAATNGFGSPLTLILMIGTMLLVQLAARAAQPDQP